MASALELDISEVKVEPPSDLGLGLQESNSGVKIRTVKSTDLTFGSGRSVQYAEVSSPKFSFSPGHQVRCLVIFV